MGNSIVLGAGLAGLNAAWSLLESGAGPVIILEKEPYVGGLAATLDWQGCRLDIGPHRIFTEISQVQKELDDLVGDEVITVQRQSHLYLGGRFLAYPPRMLQIALALGPTKLARWGFSYVWNHLAQARAVSSDEESDETFLSRRFGKALYEDFFRPFERKVWGRDPSQLSSDVAKTRVASRSLWAAVRGTTEKKGRPGTLKQFPYPPLGIGRIAERLAEKLLGRGAKILTGFVPICIQGSSDGITQLTCRGIDSNDSHTFEVDFLVTTIPLADFFAVLQTTGKETASGAAQKLHHVYSRIVYLLIDADRVRQDTWMYFPEPDLVFSRICEVKNYSEQAVPEGKTVLCVEVPRRPENFSEKALVESVIGDVCRIGMVRRESIQDTYCIQVPYAYPLYEPGYRRSLQIALDFLGSLGNAITTGRQGFFAYNNLDHSLHIGRLAAEHLLKGPEGVRAFYADRDKLCEYQIVD